LVKDVSEAISNGIDFNPENKIDLWNENYGGDFTNDPLVLDLNGDGVKLTNYSATPVQFDVDNNGGSLEKTGWISPADGMLVADLNGNGRIDNMSEIVSEYFSGQVGLNGSSGTRPFGSSIEALQSLDTDKNGIFNAQDTAWNTIKVWIDANQDGTSWDDTNGNGIIDSGEASELKSLDELGITQIDIPVNNQTAERQDGNVVLGQGSFMQWVDANGNPVAEGTAGAYLVNRETLAVGFLVDPQSVDVGSNQDVLFVDGVAQIINNNGVTFDLAPAQVEIAIGGNGNDTLIGAGASPVLISGEGGNDTVMGSETTWWIVRMIASSRTLAMA
jgi:hypothetical protein